MPKPSNTRHRFWAANAEKVYVTNRPPTLGTSLRFRRMGEANAATYRSTASCRKSRRPPAFASVAKCTLHMSCVSSFSVKRCLQIIRWCRQKAECADTSSHINSSVSFEFCNKPAIIMPSEAQINDGENRRARLDFSAVTFCNVVGVRRLFMRIAGKHKSYRCRQHVEKPADTISTYSGKESMSR